MAFGADGASFPEFASAFGGVAKFPAAPALGGGSGSPHDCAAVGLRVEVDGLADCEGFGGGDSDDDRGGGFGIAGSVILVEEMGGDRGDTEGEAVDFREVLAQRFFVGECEEGEVVDRDIHVR